MDNPYKDYFHRNADGKVSHFHYCAVVNPARPQDPVVIFREAPGNSGAPLDKVRGEVAQQVAKDLGTTVERLHWFEHKPDNTVEKHTFRRKEGYTATDHNIALTGRTDIYDVRQAGKVQRVVSDAIRMTVRQATKLISALVKQTVTLTPHDPLNPSKVKQQQRQQEQWKHRPKIRPKP